MGFDIGKLAQTESETEGVWVDFETGEPVVEENIDHLEVLVASSDTREYRHELTRRTRFTRKELRALRKDSLKVDPAVQEAIQVSLCVQFLLLGWRHMERAGQEVVYSKETAHKLLTEVPRFCDGISEIADDLPLFAEQDQTAAEET